VKDESETRLGDGNLTESSPERKVREYILTTSGYDGSAKRERGDEGNSKVHG